MGLDAVRTAQDRWETEATTADRGTVEDAAADRGVVEDAVADRGAMEDAVADRGVVEDAGTGDWPLCFEAEQVERAGAVQEFRGSPFGQERTVVLGEEGSGLLRIAFEMAVARTVHIFIRVRAVTHGHNSLYAGLGTADMLPENIWDIPVTPVLRWQRLRLRGSAGTPYRADIDPWPGDLEVGSYQLVLAGREPGVEIDRICLRADDEAPEEIFLQPPEREITHDLRDYGVVGDGVTDDVLAIRAALADLRPGDALLLPAGTYRITQRLTVPVGEVTLTGEGAGITEIFADFAPDEPGSPLLVTGGGDGESYPLLEDVVMLGRRLTVPLEASLQQGYQVTVTCDNWGPAAPNIEEPFNRWRANHAHVVEVEERVDRRILTLDRPLLSAFTVENNARVFRRRRHEQTVLRDFKVRGTNHPVDTENAHNSLVSLRCDTCFAIDMEIEHMRSTGIAVGGAIDAQVVGVHAHDATQTDGVDCGGCGYGVAFSGSHGGVVRDSRFDGVMRHGVPISWGNCGTLVFRNHFDQSSGDPSALASVDIHGQDDYANLVEQNYVLQGSPGMVVGGGGITHGNDGPWNVLRGNTLVDTYQGIVVAKETYFTIVEGNQILGTSRRGILIDSGSDDALIWNNRVTAYAYAGINVVDSDRSQVIGNDVVPGEGSAIKVENGVDYQILGNHTHGGPITEPGNGEVSGND